MDNIVTEKELIDHSKATNGERVTLADLEAAIVSEHYFTAKEGVVGKSFVRGGILEHRPVALDLMTFCVLVMWNGFTVTGQSACADPKNFDENIGRRIAKADAVRQIWPLMGYELKSRMARDQRMIGGALVEPQFEFTTYIGTKVVNAIPCNRFQYNELRGWTLPADENGDDEGYLVEYTDRVENPPHVNGFQGYISWSPKEVFERAYRPVRQGATATASAEGAGEASV